ncbi:MAG TPA: tail fiber domain-containing protein [Chitinophagales bacterium]|nr:tail fiber domain-containing protein [Chitinophagales bacterium]
MKKLVTILITLVLISPAVIHAQSWNLLGNAGTNVNTNFLGTTDGKALVIRTNNVERLRITSAGRFGFGTNNPSTSIDIIGTFKAGGIIGFCKIDTTGNLFPSVSNSSDLGSSGGGWKNIYINGSVFLDKQKFIDNGGTVNTFIGHTGVSSTSGSYNTFVGDSCGLSNTLGSSNCFLGALAGFSNTGGYNNSHFGAYSGYSNGTGYENSFFGKQSGYSNTKGHDNCFFGFAAGKGNTQGNNNVGIGDSSLISNSQGSNNTCVGYRSDVTFVLAGSNSTALGAGAKADNSNKVAIGNTSITAIQGQVSFTTYSDARVKNTIQENVPGLSFITSLRPVTYHYDINKENELLGVNDKTTWTGKYDIERMQFSGFIAQEVDAAAKKIGYDFSGVDKSGNMWGLRYSEFVVPLVKAVQELNAAQAGKDAVIAQQQAQIDAQQKQIDDLKAQMQQFDQSLSQCCTSYKSATSIQSSTIDLPMLEQNNPNPFIQGTTIKFYLPQTATSASVKIYSLDGVELKSFNLNEKGFGEVSIAGNSLAPGVYAYTLIIDGKAIDTKQMILTK